MRTAIAIALTAMLASACGDMDTHCAAQKPGREWHNSANGYFVEPADCKRYLWDIQGGYYVTCTRNGGVVCCDSKGFRLVCL
jgi:hypothetical protein